MPVDALNRSFALAPSAQALMVVGTLAVVSPANTLPMLAKQNGAKIIEINIKKTHQSESVIDVFIQGGAGEVMKALVTAVKERTDSGDA